VRRFWAPTRQALRFGFANFDEITVGAYLGHDAAMLVAGKFGAAVAALGIRRPSPKTAAVAAKDEKLRAYAESKQGEVRIFAEKGLIAKRWVFAGVQTADADGFFRELNVSRFRTSSDRKSNVGLTLGGALVGAEEIDQVIDDQLGRILILGFLAKGRAPQCRGMKKNVAAESKKFEKDLRRRYGSKQ